MKVIQFLRYRYLAFALSLAVIAAGFTLTWVQGGFNLGLDFQAGIRIQVKIDPSVQAPIDQVRGALSSLDNPQIQAIGPAVNQEYAVKVKQVGESKTFGTEMEEKVREALDKRFGVGKVRILQTEYVGPRFSADLASQAMFLTLFALLLIMLYSWFRFKLAYAVAAIAATVHDPLLMIGIIGATQMEVSTATVAAVLTIIGYSINDTIVVFDRIRENVRLMRETPFPAVIDTSITQSLSRTIITSLTTILAILAVYVFGTGDVKLFALNVIIGVVVGTYSSIFIASPILLELKTLGEKWRKRKEGGPSAQGVSKQKGTETESKDKWGTDRKPEPASKDASGKASPATGALEPVVSPEATAEPKSQPASDGQGVLTDTVPQPAIPAKAFLPPRMSREKRKRKGKRG